MKEKIMKVLEVIIFMAFGLLSFADYSSATLITGDTVGITTTYELLAKGDYANIGTTGAVATEFTNQMQIDFHDGSSGTGVIQPFLTINAGGIERGVNTDGTPLPFDDQRKAYNNAITKAQLAAANYGFALDINEPKNVNETLLLEEFKIWVVPSAAGGSLINGNNSPDFATMVTLLESSDVGGIQVFDLDPPIGSTITENNNILLHYNIWKGSGQNLDMLLEVPTGIFDLFADEDFLYVWAQFSLSNHGGFEEWILLGSPRIPPVPEPSTFLLLGAGLAGMVFLARKRKKE